MNASDIDIFEVNEALQWFQCVWIILISIIPLYVNGGAIAMGHPLATGCMIPELPWTNQNVKIKVPLWQLYVLVGEWE
jgi:hypothetical protein